MVPGAPGLETPIPTSPSRGRHARAAGGSGEEWIFQFDVTTWGWIHLILGVIAAIAGFFLLRGAVWARTIGVIVAVGSAILNFAWLPYHPVWAIAVIVVDVFVIWALTAHGRDITKV